MTDAIDPRHRAPRPALGRDAANAEQGRASSRRPRRRPYRLAEPENWALSRLYRRASIHACADAVLAYRRQELDALFNNGAMAGWGHRDLTTDVLRRQFETNVLGLAHADPPDSAGDAGAGHGRVISARPRSSASSPASIAAPMSARNSRSKN